MRKVQKIICNLAILTWLSVKSC